MAEMKKGYRPRSYTDMPLGSLPYLTPFDIPTIPESEWVERIDYLNANKSSLVHVQEAAGIKALSQGNFPYCWGYGTVTGLAITRAAAGLPHANMNPHALAAQVMNFRDRGGNLSDSIPWLIEHGCPTYNTWPEYSMDRNLANSKEVKEDAIKYRLTEYWELQPNDIEQLVTCLLSGIPVTIGVLDMGHMMLAEAVDYRKRGNSIEYGLAILNSWGPTSGEKKDGRVYRWGSNKMRMFEQAAPRVSTVSV